jgi:glycosyltransferase involved in cell wall biosynthesis
MLSILIPVYNFHIIELVEDLNFQAKQAKIDFEIIVIDDASEENYKIKNRKIRNIRGVKYYEERENLGRSRIRNKLTDISSFPYLLFVDCDSKVHNKNYIQKYLKYCVNDVVVCGGRLYESDEPDNRLDYIHLHRSQLLLGRQVY